MASFFVNFGIMFQYFFSIDKADFSLKKLNGFKKKWFIALQSLAKDIIQLEQIEWETDLLHC